MLQGSWPLLVMISLGYMLIVKLRLFVLCLAFAYLDVLVMPLTEKTGGGLQNSPRFVRGTRGGNHAAVGGNRGCRATASAIRDNPAARSMFQTGRAGRLADGFTIFLGVFEII